MLSQGERTEGEKRPHVPPLLSHAPPRHPPAFRSSTNTCTPPRNIQTSPPTYQMARTNSGHPNTGKTDSLAPIATGGRLRIDWSQTLIFTHRLPTQTFVSQKRRPQNHLHLHNERQKQDEKVCPACAGAPPSDIGSLICAVNSITFTGEEAPSSLKTNDNMTHQEHQQQHATTYYGTRRFYARIRRASRGTQRHRGHQPDGNIQHEIQQTNPTC